MKRPTPFLVVGIIFFVVAIPYLLYKFLISRNAEIGEVLLLFLVLPVLVFVLIDRLLLRFLKYKIVIIAELLLLVIGTIFYAYSGRSTTIEILNPNIPYLMIVENNGELTDTPSFYQFPFNRIIRTTDSIIVVPDLSKMPRLIVPEKWQEGYFYDEIFFPNLPKVLIFSSPDESLERKYLEDELRKSMKVDSVMDSK